MKGKTKAVSSVYFCERPGSSLDAELCVTELTVAGVRRRQPLLQTALVHRAQCACAVARGQQTFTAASLVADTTDGAIADTKKRAT